MSNQPSSATNVFDAAKAIVEILKDLDKQTQTQAIRFANESLGISAPVADHGSMVAPVPAAMTTPLVITTQTHSTDIKQFTAAKAPKSDRQFAAVVAYFYRFEAPENQRKETIDSKVLQEAARLAARTRPSKPGMTLTNAKNAGYLDQVGRGNFKINAVGENLVAMTLPGNASNESAGRSVRNKRGPNKKTPVKKREKRGT